MGSRCHDRWRTYGSRIIGNALGPWSRLESFDKLRTRRSFLGNPWVLDPEVLNLDTWSLDPEIFLGNQ